MSMRTRLWLVVVYAGLIFGAVAARQHHWRLTGFYSAVFLVSFSASAISAGFDERRARSRA